MAQRRCCGQTRTNLSRLSTTTTITSDFHGDGHDTSYVLILSPSSLFLTYLQSSLRRMGHRYSTSGQRETLVVWRYPHVNSSTCCYRYDDTAELLLPPSALIWPYILDYPRKDAASSYLAVVRTEETHLSSAPGSNSTLIRYLSPFYSATTEILFTLISVSGCQFEPRNLPVRGRGQKITHPLRKRPQTHETATGFLQWAAFTVSSSTISFVFPAIRNAALLLSIRRLGGMDRIASELHGLCSFVLPVLREITLLLDVLSTNFLYA